MIPWLLRCVAVARETFLHPDCTSYISPGGAIRGREPTRRRSIMINLLFVFLCAFVFALVLWLVAVAIGSRIGGDDVY
jgi:hypothetical protein